MSDTTFKPPPAHTSPVGLFLNMGTVVLASDGPLARWAAMLPKICKSYLGVFSRHGASTGRSERKWN
ncbi:hypothetical protein C8Q79DRAFT_1010316 [Trametes meyenii]|nr:hypothetical protein C8Q79DRAFT_1014942 [Trametes meyenii]KAI0645344.1 hypothetical protein C8Q79DRAFT_1010316 [Trametes meyenii]